jgi:hypothetical protein
MYNKYSRIINGLLNYRILTLIIHILKICIFLLELFSIKLKDPYQKKPPKSPALAEKNKKTINKKLKCPTNRNTSQMRANPDKNKPFVTLNSLIIMLCVTKIRHINSLFALYLLCSTMLDKYRLATPFKCLSLNKRVE